MTLLNKFRAAAARFIEPPPAPVARTGVVWCLPVTAVMAASKHVFKPHHAGRYFSREPEHVYLTLLADGTWRAQTVDEHAETYDGTTRT